MCGWSEAGVTRVNNQGAELMKRREEEARPKNEERSERRRKKGVFGGNGEDSARAVNEHTFSLPGCLLSFLYLSELVASGNGYLRCSSSLVSSTAVSVYFGADLTILSAIVVFSLHGEGEFE
jgi:hypothetical protein